MEAFDVTVQVAEQEQESISWMTVERVAYLAIGLLAAALRFFQLGLRPLGEAEAVQSLAAFRFTQDMTQSATAGTIPALFTGDVIGFTLMGASDATARWLPALAGVIMALLPYGLRRRLGRGGALAASVLLALSPSAAFFSRSLDSAILVAACGLAMTVGLINYLDTHRQGHLYFLAAALGLGLTAGRGTYTLLLIWVAFAMVLYLGERFGGREEGWSSLLVGWSTLRSEQGLLAKTGAVLAATFGLVTMTFVLHPAGVGHAADLVGDWAKGFLPEPDGQPFIYPVLLLFRYELLILFLGFVEIGRWLVRGRSEGRGDVQFGPLFPHTAFLVFWAAVGLLIILIAGHRSAGDILLVVVPLALLAGQGMQRAWCWISQRGLWFEAGVFALVAMGVTTFFYLQMAAFGASSPTATDSLAGINLYASLTYLIFGVLAVLLLVGLGAVSWVLRGPQLVLAGGWLAAVIILGLLGFSAMWGASFDHASDARELMIMETTVPDVRLFGEQLEALSLDRAGDAHSLPITVDAVTGPVVAWYLRDFQQQSVVEGLSSAPETVAAVTLAAQDLPIGETFRGQGFPLRTHWLPWGLWGQDLIRWLLFNEGSLPVVDQEVVLWVLSEP